LSGNAGDGKTAYIQRIEEPGKSSGAQNFSQTDNGCSFTLNGLSFQTLYDGSQDFEGTNNDDVLAGFFKEFEGDKPPTALFTKIIAINEGKLRDFILSKRQYKWLGKEVHHYLNFENYAPHDA